ncbi:hypothetical protein VE03_07079 [Pseudogymnoascus sp. 23342-1-I1]|nr:hypothetical protein VE03_07079 [Pseudogymnoascus sp. 23342-1-I1]
MYPNNWEVVYAADNLKRIHHFSSGPEYAEISGRVTINDLPSELIVRISKYIPDSIISGKDFPRYNSRSLLQLALCSRRFYRLVEPVIYERFHHGAETSTKGFLMFLVRILARPDLGRCVRVFCVDGTKAPGLGIIMEDDHDEMCHIYMEFCHGHYDSDFDVSYFTVEDLKAVRKKIAEASTTTLECYEWAAGVEKGDLNAMIALILTLAPNLQVLDIDTWTRPDSVPPILTRMLAQAGQLQRERQLGQPFALWRLKKVVVRYHHASAMDEIIHHLISLLTIPSVEILSAIHEDAVEDYYCSPETDVNEGDLEAALQGINLGLANMKELSFSFMPMSPNTLFRLWCCYPNLKKFSYRDNLGDD